MPCREIWPAASPWSAISWAASTAARPASGGSRRSPEKTQHQRRRSHHEGQRQLPRTRLGAWRADRPAARRDACARDIRACGWSADFAAAHRPLVTRTAGASAAGRSAQAARRMAVRPLRLFGAGRRMARGLVARDWRASERESLALALAYPTASPVERVERTVVPDPSAPAIDIELKVIVRRA